jgi:hypothetical protein
MVLLDANASNWMDSDSSSLDAASTLQLTTYVTL